MGNLLETRPRGVSWWRELAAEQGHNTFLMAFSRGKDSIAATLSLLEAGFDLIPFTMIGVPGLSFVEESLTYYERVLFGGRHIIRAMYPHFARIFTEGAYQPPERLAIAEACGFGFDISHIQNSILQGLDMPADTYTAIGVRAFDNMMRRKIIAVNGPVVASKRQFYSIWDMSIAQLINIITRHDVNLPPDYRLWGHSFYEIQPEYLFAIREHYPDDYRKILEWFPLAQAEMFRFDHMVNAA